MDRLTQTLINLLLFVAIGCLATVLIFFVGGLVVLATQGLC